MAVKKSKKPTLNKKVVLSVKPKSKPALKRKKTVIKKAAVSKRSIFRTRVVSKKFGTKKSKPFSKKRIIIAFVLGCMAIAILMAPRIAEITTLGSTGSVLGISSPSTPSNVSASGYGNQIYITFKKSSYNSADGFYFYCDECVGSQSKIDVRMNAIGDEKNTSGGRDDRYFYIFTNLAYDTKYSFRISTYKLKSGGKIEESSRSNRASASTREQEPAPEILSITNNGQRSTILFRGHSYFMEPKYEIVCSNCNNGGSKISSFSESGTIRYSTSPDSRNLGDDLEYSLPFTFPAGAKVTMRSYDNVRTTHDNEPVLYYSRTSLTYIIPNPNAIISYAKFMPYQDKGWYNGNKIKFKSSKNYSWYNLRCYENKTGKIKTNAKMASNSKDGFRYSDRGYSYFYPCYLSGVDWDSNKKADIWGPEVMVQPPDPIENEGEISSAAWLYENEKDANVKFSSKEKQDWYNFWCNDLSGKKIYETNMAYSELKESRKQSSYLSYYKFSINKYAYKGRKCYIAGVKWSGDLGKNLWGPYRELPFVANSTNDSKITYAKWYNKNSKQAKLIGGEVAQVKFASDIAQKAYTMTCYNNAGAPILDIALDSTVSGSYIYSNNYYTYSNRKCYIGGYSYYASLGKNLWGKAMEITN